MMLGLRMLWSQSMRLTCLAWIFQAAPSRTTRCPGPAGEHSGFVAPEFADQKIRPHHARIVARGGKNFDIGDEAHRARRRRLRPGESGAHPVDPILEPAAVVEHHRNLAPRIAGARRRRHPVDAFGRVHGEPVVVAQLVEEARLAFDEPAEFVAHGDVGDGARIVLPVREIFDQRAIERVVDVVRRARRIGFCGRRVHVTARAGWRGSGAPSSAASIP